jgi:hypothetical protein
MGALLLRDELHVPIAYPDGPETGLQGRRGGGLDRDLAINGY